MSYAPGFYWCHGCKRWHPALRAHDGTYRCDECGETILCDECGQEWTDDHGHAEVTT